ncbi:metal-dependent hydrolase [Pontibacter sp. KCTC 32443]|uniref:metal-dependent hydrolase n=1 Tax=Pontibacter TaxID=323449 RepID=UPI00164DA3EF|nr:MULTISPECIES: metal-dependent hydrolase [Pontibacter]MBC5773390.1 metal-dependent hydrolase [Pontibacter sp. KCTC 32443]
MDSLTQVVLGASVGEVILGKKLGNKSLLWGGIAGTIPDLDILANPLLDMVGQLSFHRSLTHSFLFAIVVSPLLGLLLKRFNKKDSSIWQEWGWLFFWGFVTHALLDSCTTWGTQLFWPFSTYGVAFYNIFVIDPLYTLPFLGFVFATGFYNKNNRKRRILNYTGLALSTAYLLFSFGAKAAANNVFEQNLQRQGIAYSSYISKPTPLNTIFWSVTVKGNGGFYNGFYSLFDEDKNVKYSYEPQNKHLLKPYRGNPRLERLLEITKGYYTVVPAEKGVYINDLRFGKFDDWRKEGGGYVFVYHVWQNLNGSLEFKEINNRPKLNKAYFKDYWRRIMGNK